MCIVPAAAERGGPFEPTDPPEIPRLYDGKPVLGQSDKADVITRGTPPGASLSPFLARAKAPADAVGADTGQLAEPAGTVDTDQQDPRAIPHPTGVGTVTTILLSRAAAAALLPSPVLCPPLLLLHLLALSIRNPKSQIRNRRAARRLARPSTFGPFCTNVTKNPRFRRRRICVSPCRNWNKIFLHAGRFYPPGYCTNVANPTSSVGNCGIRIPVPDPPESERPSRNHERGNGLHYG